MVEKQCTICGKVVRARYFRGSSKDVVCVSCRAWVAAEGKRQAKHFTYVNSACAFCGKPTPHLLSRKPVCTPCKVLARRINRECLVCKGEVTKRNRLLCIDCFPVWTRVYRRSQLLTAVEVIEEARWLTGHTDRPKAGTIISNYCAAGGSHRRLSKATTFDEASISRWAAGVVEPSNRIIHMLLRELRDATTITS